MGPKSQPIEILLVEDNPADVRLTVEALREGKVLNNLHVAKDGIEALDFLHQRGDYQSAVRPDLILLDLNLLRLSGQEVLQQIKTDDSLMCIPVIVLTTSEAEEDILSSYGLHANCYICKPVGLEKFLEVVKTIEDFWLTIVTLPNA